MPPAIVVSREYADEPILIPAALNRFAPFPARYTQMVWRSSNPCMRRAAPFVLLMVFFLPLFTTGCGVFLRTRPVEEIYSKAPLRESSQAALIESINQQAQKLQS